MPGVGDVEKVFHPTPLWQGMLLHSVDRYPNQVVMELVGGGVSELLRRSWSAVVACHGVLHSVAGEICSGLGVRPTMNPGAGIEISFDACFVGRWRSIRTSGGRGGRCRPRPGRLTVADRFAAVGWGGRRPHQDAHGARR